MLSNLNVIGYDQSMHNLISLEEIHIIYRSLKIGISEVQLPLCVLWHFHIQPSHVHVF